MSRLFSSSLNRIDFGSPANLDDINVFTYCGWINPTNTGTTRPIIQKGGATGKIFRVDAATNNGGLEAIVAMSTTNARARSTVGQLTVGTWNFIAVTFDGSFNIKIFKGAIGGVVAEVSYIATYPIQGVGTITSDASANLLIGGDSSSDARANLAEWMIIPAAVNAAQLTALMYNAFPSALSWYAPLHGTSSGEPDLSGNANNGTVTGATYSAHPPISNRFAPNPFSPYVVAPAGEPSFSGGANSKLAIGIGIGMSF